MGRGEGNAGGGRWELVGIRLKEEWNGKGEINLS